MKRIACKWLLAAAILQLFSLGVMGNPVLMPSGISSEPGQKSVQIAESVQFYDHGGKDGPFAEWQMARITFVPRAGERIKIQFTTCALGTAKVHLFHGLKALESDMDEYDPTYFVPSGAAKVLTGTEVVTLISEKADGKLTVCFESGAGVTGDGWVATVSSEPLAGPSPAPQPTLFPTLAVYTVGGTPIDFYDDGGLANPISKDFDGQVVFKPTTPGAKLQVEFKKVQLFYNSSAVSVGREDKLFVYQGEKPLAANKLGQITETPQTFRSVSDDGSLTITLKSVTAYPKAGFEAVVSEYLPQSMAYVQASIEPASSKTVAAGDLAQDLLWLNVTTTGNASPLSLHSAKFTLGSSSPQAIAKATLYYHAKGKTQDGVKVGEVPVAGDEYTISLGAGQQLHEGDNYFRLAVDIDDKLPNDAVVTALCPSLTLSGGEQLLETAQQPSVARTVYNLHRSVKGPITRSVYTPWQFTHSPSKYNYDNYLEVEEDQVTTFKPGAPNSAVEMVFADFDVKYSGGYGVQAKFIIYDGPSASGTKLWEVNADNCKKGPERPIRSTHPTGALTILFNANATLSYSCGKGWHASVTSFERKPMVVQEVAMLTATPSALAPGGTRRFLLGFNLKTHYPQNPLALQEIVLTLQGHQQLAKIEIFTSGVSPVMPDLSVATPVATLADPAAEAVVILPPAMLEMGDNHFWITADVRPDATEGASVQFTLKSAKVSGTAHTPTGNSSGSVLIRNEYLMQSGDHERILQPGEILHFYDDGGPNNVYSANFKGSVVFTPPAGQFVQMHILELRVDGPAPFRIYNGDNDDMANNLLWHNLFAMPSVLDYTSTDPSGKLKVKFSSSDIVYPDRLGWHIEVKAVGTEALRAGDIEVTNVAPEFTLPGAEGVSMLRIAVQVDGVQGSLALGDMEFSLDGSSANTLQAASLLYSGQSDLPSGAAVSAPLPPAPASTFTVRPDAVIRKPGKHYFWLVYSAQQLASDGAKLAARLTGVKASDGVSLFANVKLNQAALSTIQPRAGMSGSYTIGASPTCNYSTFHQAIQDLLKKGVAGPVVFTVEPGVYSEVLSLPQINGTTPFNTITFKPQGGPVVVEHNDWKHIGTPGVDTDRHGVVTLRGADYVLFQDIEFRTTDKRYYSLVSLLHRSTNITFSMCRFVAPVCDGQQGRDVRHIALADTAVTGLQTNDNLHVQGCRFTDGYIGIALAGVASVNAPRERGARIIANTFTNVASMAIFAFQQEDLVVEGNAIYADRTEALEAMGFAAKGLYGPARIVRNRIRLLTAKDNRGIELRTPNIGSDSYPILVANNEIHITSAANSSNTYAILLGTNEQAQLSQHVKVLHNSVLIDGPDCKNCGALKLYGTAQDTHIDQNLLQVPNAKGKVYAAYMLDPQAKGFAFARNGAWSKGLFASVAGSLYDADKWKQYDPNQVHLEASFVDPTHRLALYNGVPFQVGQPYALVRNDIDGKLRPATNLTLGAREFVKPPLAFDAGYPRIEAKDKNSITFAVAAMEDGATFYYKLVLASEEAPAESAIIEQIPVGRTKVTHTISALTPATSYVLYFYLLAADGRKTSVAALPAVKTDLPTGTPLLFTEATPALVTTYADAALFRFTLSTDATVRYAVREKGAEIPPLSSFDPAHTIAVLANQAKEYAFQQLLPNAQYVLYVYAESADGQTTLLHSLPFGTEHATTFAPSILSEKEEGIASPFSHGTQLFNGFSIVKASFPGDYGPVRAAKVSQPTASITVNTTRYLGETISGLYVRYSKPFTMRLVDGAGNQTDENVPLTDCEWLYVPLAKYGPVQRIELTPTAEGSLEIYSVGQAQHMGPEIYIDAPTPVALNAPTTLRARLNGCAWPYTVQWTTGDGATILGTQLQQAITPTQAQQVYKFTVRDALGQNAATVDLRAGEALQIATFEDLDLPAGSTWRGDAHSTLVQFASGSFAFPNFSHPSDGWGGFAYSSDASTEWDGVLTHDGRSAAGKGANGSATWGVYYTSQLRQGTRSFALQVAPNGTTLPGLWVTNSAYAYSAMSKGNALSGDKFGSGDYLKVSFRANGKQVDYYLADYRSAEATEHYILDQWAWVDLSALGAVDKVAVEMEGSRSNAQGQTLPLYLCLDDIGSSRPEITAQPVQVFATSTEPLRVPLATLAGMEEDALHAQPEGDWTWPNGTQVALEGNALTVATWSGAEDMSRDFVVRLSRRGVTQWLRIPVQLRTLVPTYTFGGYTIASGQGTVTITVAGNPLEKGQTVKPTDDITVKAVEAQGWRLPAAGAIQAIGATPVDGGLWRATADGFTFTVSFEQIPPATYTLLACDWTGNGAVSIRNAAGQALEQGATLTEGELLTLTFSHEQGYTEDVAARKIVGLESTSEGLWKVVGDVTVSAVFIKEPEPTPPAPAEYTILQLSVEGQGTLTLTRPDGHQLKVNDKVPQGTILTLTTTPATGHQLDRVITEGLQSKGNGLWMVEADVKVTVLFKPNDHTDATADMLASITVYPNPVEHTLHVDNAQPATRFALYDARGGLLRSGTLAGRADMLEMAHLPAGIYLLRLVAADGSTRALRVVKR